MYHRCFLEMKPLESHPLFNPEIKVTEAPKVEKKPPPVLAGKDELDLNLFEQANQTPAEKCKFYTLTRTHVCVHICKNFTRALQLDDV